MNPQNIKIKRENFDNYFKKFDNYFERLQEVSPSTVCVSILAGIITISESYVNVTQAYEKWTKYRATCNSLWIETRYFSMKAGRYADEKTRINEFVNRCESLMIEETNEWKIYIEKAKEMK